MLPVTAQAKQRALILTLPVAAGLSKSLLFLSCLAACLALGCNTLMYLVTHSKTSGACQNPGVLHNTTGYDTLFSSEPF